MAQWEVLVSWKGGKLTKGQLIKHFEKFDPIDVIIEQTEQPSNQNNALIRFHTQKQAELARDETNGNILNGVEIEVVIKVKDKIEPETLKRNLSPQKSNQSTESSSQPPIEQDQNIKNSQQDQFQATIYIGNLSPDAVEQDLSDFFIQGLKDPNCLKSVKLCRNRFPPYKSLKYGYINFTDQEFAQKALKELNYKHIKGNPCRLMEYRKDSNQRNKTEGNLFVSNLPINFQPKELSDLFSGAGNILSVRISNNPYNDKLNGYVQFKTQQEADNAIEKFNNIYIHGKKIVVERFNPNKNEQRTVVISNLSINISDDKVIELMSQFGTVQSINSTQSKNNSQERVVFVQFDAEQSAQLY
ncbi:MAG: putative polyadenylate-binding protein 1 [Streblomastix strix]|uniref:Putative polyadenylate-binding protein 1 n=1 Tax=Streblomastix strix TaxID=222440 RepID=A0A5J4V9U1_9EUKA|nr:MAG: putative polyadenylate-binding protein 1 [Streblomastix strix]